MRFPIGEIVVDVVVDQDAFELPLGEFLPGLDLGALREQRGLLEPDFVDPARNFLNARSRRSSCASPGAPSWSTPASASTRIGLSSRPE